MIDWRACWQASVNVIFTFVIIHVVSSLWPLLIESGSVWRELTVFLWDGCSVVYVYEFTFEIFFLLRNHNYDSKSPKFVLFRKFSQLGDSRGNWIVACFSWDNVPINYRLVIFAEWNLRPLHVAKIDNENRRQNVLICKQILQWVFTLTSPIPQLANHQFINMNKKSLSVWIFELSALYRKSDDL